EVAFGARRGVDGAGADPGGADFRSGTAARSAAADGFRNRREPAAAARRTKAGGRSAAAPGRSAAQARNERARVAGKFAARAERSRRSGFCAGKSQRPGGSIKSTGGGNGGEGGKVEGGAAGCRETGGSAAGFAGGGAGAARDADANPDRPLVHGGRGAEAIRGKRARRGAGVSRRWRAGGLRGSAGGARRRDRTVSAG